MSYSDLEFGLFLAPFQTLEENPSAAIDRDLALLEWIDELGYDYAWIGEHHSAGFESIASPEVFIAAAAQRTRNIKLGTGVSSLPFHHPLIIADRMNQLDHMTRGRVAFGVGPGALPADASMMGIETGKQREMMLESIEVLVPLLRGETVSKKTTWFELNEARLQLQPYSKPMIEMAVASQVSPAGARAAGRFGLGLLSIGATSHGGFNTLAVNWEIYERKARENHQPAARSKWSLVGPVHIAETREQAFENVRYGIDAWVSYFRDMADLSVAPQAEGVDPAQAMVDSGLAVIGTAEDAITQIKRLQQQSGGFGAFLQMAHNWADREQTQKSYELFARHVAPIFQSRNDYRRASYGWSGANHGTFVAATESTIKAEIEKDQVEQLALEQQKQQQKQEQQQEQQQTEYNSGKDQTGNEGSKSHGEK